MFAVYLSFLLLLQRKVLDASLGFAAGVRRRILLLSLLLLLFKHDVDVHDLQNSTRHFLIFFFVSLYGTTVECLANPKQLVSQ